MSLSSIGSTSWQPASGALAPRLVHRHNPTGSAPAAAVITTSAADASALASAVVAALTQLGMVPASGANNTGSIGNAQTATVSQQLPGSKQVQQYRNIASTVSNLAQAMNASSSNALPTSNGAGSLTTVFQDLWSSLGSSSGTAADASGNSIPSLPSFLQTLARNFSESGVSGLRGAFVDTVV
jgi:hypothetical protein